MRDTLHCLSLSLRLHTCLGPVSLSLYNPLCLVFLSLSPYSLFSLCFSAFFRCFNEAVFSTGMMFFKTKGSVPSFPITMPFLSICPWIVFLPSLPPCLFLSNSSSMNCSYLLLYLLFNILFCCSSLFHMIPAPMSNIFGCIQIMVHENILKVKLSTCFLFSNF